MFSGMHMAADVWLTGEMEHVSSILTPNILNSYRVTSSTKFSLLSLLGRTSSCVSRPLLVIVRKT
jgi:hypothetical protein